MRGAKARWEKKKIKANQSIIASSIAVAKICSMVGIFAKFNVCVMFVADFTFQKYI